jgi:hypothetical protein
MRALTKPKSRVEADLSPSRATATILNAAPDAQSRYTTANHNSGGGRTEEQRDRVNQQQIDRSRISNRTRARGTEIAAGTTSADGWTTLPPNKQAAAIEMRVGQNGGPLPFEAIIDFGEPIINGALATTKRWIRRLRGKIKGVFCNKVYVTRKSWNIFLDKENQEGGADNLVFQSRGIPIRSKGNGQTDGRATFGWVSVTRDQRRERPKHQPNAACLFRAERLAAGLEQIRRPSMASSTAANAVTLEPKVTMMDFHAKAHGRGGGRDGKRCRERLRLGRAVRREDEVKPAPALLLRAARLGAGEAQVEAEGDEVNLQAEELRTATTPSKEEAWGEITSTDL